MKDFRLVRKAGPKYILDVNVVKGKTTSEDSTGAATLAITFGDGRVFKNIEYNRENLEKIILQQERQAAEGVKNLNIFEKRKTKAGIMTGASIVGGPVIGAVTASLLPNPVTTVIGAGILTIAAAVPSVCSLIRNSGKVSELRKIEYRDENIDQLQAYPSYENALAGLPRSKKNWFEAMAEDGENPFCITEIDEYSKNDLERIMDNIAIEKTYQFTYAPRPNVSKK